MYSRSVVNVMATHMTTNSVILVRFFMIPLTYDKKMSLRKSKVYFIFEFKIIVKKIILYSIYRIIR